MSKVIIRYANPDDTLQFVELQRTLARETQFLLPTSSEVLSMKTEKQYELLDKMSKGEIPAKVIVAYSDNELAGFLGFSMATQTRQKHLITRVALGVRKEYYRRGIGTDLLKELEKYARDLGVSRIEFTVLCNNQAAIALYLKEGFEIEGTRRDSVIDDSGILLDEYYLAKLIS